MVTLARDPEGVNLDLSVQTLLDERAKTATYAGPVTAPPGTSDADLLRLMNLHGIGRFPWWTATVELST